MSNTATGPRSEEGKERSAVNATVHGLCSERNLVPGEVSAEWEHFQAEVVSEYRPATFTERELAERIALQMWRQRRAGRYEATADTLARVIRYEAHVTRQLKEARKMLFEMQAERRSREAAALRMMPAPAVKPVAPQAAPTSPSSFRNFGAAPSPVDPPQQPEPLPVVPMKVQRESARSCPIAHTALPPAPTIPVGRS